MRNPHLAELWREEISSFPVGEARIRDGHAYFLRGAVHEFCGKPGHLEAKVQGSRPEPYEVQIGMDLLAPDAWNRLLDWLEDNDWDKSELENGRISMALSMQLESLQLHLVPRKYKELRTECGCPDWMRPCKHVLAVCFAFALEIEHDPQVLLRLRGGNLASQAQSDPTPQTETLTESLEQLSTDPNHFWKPAASLEELGVQIGLPEESSIRRYWQRLGPLPFWGGSFDLSPLLRPLYEEVRAARLRGSLDSKADQKS
jgi:uncharacterized Zn finger protein